MTYLDTHVVVWLYARDMERIPSRVKIAIDEDDLSVSPMVGLELQYLLESGKIGTQPKDVLGRLAEELGLAVCRQDFGGVATQATLLGWTRDPFDRIITAQASVTKSRLITKDRVIRTHYKHALWD